MSGGVGRLSWGIGAVCWRLLLLAVAGRAAAAEDVIYAVPNGDWRLMLQRFEPQAIRGRRTAGPVARSR